MDLRERNVKEKTHTRRRVQVEEDDNLNLTLKGASPMVSSARFLLAGFVFLVLWLPFFV